MEGSIPRFWIIRANCLQLPEARDRLRLRLGNAHQVALDLACVLLSIGVRKSLAVRSMPCI